MKTGATLFWILLTISLILGACTPGLRNMAPNKEATSEELFNLFFERKKEHQTVKAMVSFSIHPNQGVRRTLNGILSFNSGNLRFQGFDSFGRTLVDLILLKNNFYKISLGGEPSVKGHLTDRGRLVDRPEKRRSEEIDWNFWLKMMKELHYGGNPVIEEENVFFIEKGAGDLTCSIFEIRAPQARLLKKIWLERSFFYPVKEEIYEERNGSYSTAGTFYFSEFNEKNKGSWPGRIQVKSKEGELEIEFLEINFTPSFSVDTFNTD